MELTVEQKRAMALASARKRAAQAQGGESWTPGQQDTMQAPQQPQNAQSFGTMAPQEPTMGSRVFDALNSMGLPADRMRGDLQTVDDLVRGTANGLTFGVADRLAGMVGGEGTEAERKKSEMAQQRSPIAYTGGEIGGAVAGIGKLQGMGLTAGKFLPQNADTLMRAGASVLDGLAINELLNAGYGRDFGTGADTAAIVGGAAPIVGDLATAGASKAAGMFNKAPKTMSLDELKSASDAAYKRADDAGVIYSPEALQRVTGNLKNDFADFGYHPELQPGAKVALGELERISQGNVTLKGLDTTRKIANNAFQPMNKSNNALTLKVKNSIDDLVQNPQQGDVIAGNTEQAASAIKEARDMYGRSAKIEKIQYLLDRAGLNAGSAGSGGNLQNATRQQLKTLINKPSNKDGFTKDELSAIKKTVLGTPTQNALRSLGQMGPAGNGLSKMLWAGAATGSAALNPAVLAPMALGAAATTGAKKAAEIMTARNVEKLQKLIAAGGKASALQAPKNAAQMSIEAKKDMIARMIMGGGLTMAPLN